MKTILVVEDEPEALENLVMMLELEGYRAIAASNGRAGLAADQVHGPGHSGPGQLAALAGAGRAAIAARIGWDAGLAEAWQPGEAGAVRGQGHGWLRR